MPTGSPMPRRPHVYQPLNRAFRSISSAFRSASRAFRSVAHNHQSFALAAALLVLLPGCVERTMKIPSRPAGAIVYVNDEEVGKTPVKLSFTWYGDYDLV